MARDCLPWTANSFPTSTGFVHRSRTVRFVLIVVQLFIWGLCTFLLCWGWWPGYGYVCLKIPRFYEQWSQPSDLTTVGLSKNGIRAPFWGRKMLIECMQYFAAVQSRAGYILNLNMSSLSATSTACVGEVNGQFRIHESYNLCTALSSWDHGEEMVPYRCLAMVWGPPLYRGADLNHVGKRITATWYCSCWLFLDNVH